MHAGQLREDWPVGFFDAFPLPPPPPERAPRGGARTPVRAQMLGGFVPWRIVLLRSGVACVVLQDFEAFPMGVQFELISKVKVEPDVPDPGWRDALPRLGVGFADGRKVATHTARTRDALEDPASLVLRTENGGGGRAGWRQGYWLSPLPPPGPLTWAAVWPTLGFDEAVVITDATELVQAAAQTRFFGRTARTGGERADDGLRTSAVRAVP